jgi:hypothetical protein
MTDELQVDKPAYVPIPGAAGLPSSPLGLSPVPSEVFKISSCI